MKRLLSRPARLARPQILVGKTLIHLLLLGMLAFQFQLGLTDQLGADPVQALLNFTGLNAIHLLLITLLVSPAAKHLPCADLLKYRRLLGLYVFVYAMAHLATYILFELQLNWPLVGSEIIKRPYITVGFAALLILAALSVTSLNNIRRRMGRRWQKLHNLIYLCVPLALLHYSWSQKVVLAEPLIYWAIAILILILRKDKFRMRRRPR